MVVLFLKQPHPFLRKLQDLTAASHVFHHITRINEDLYPLTHRRLANTQLLPYL
jgi:hypothetical protein